LLNVWSLRRVLLPDLPGEMPRTMEMQLCAVGARPVHASVPFSEESLSLALQRQRCTCVIVPDLLALHTGDPSARFDALNTLLFEAREAGVPLVMLLGSICSMHDEESAQLFSHALGFVRGAFGDPVSIQCIRHNGCDLQRICRDALMLGARFLSGERSCTGVFTLERTMALPPHTPTGAFAP